MKHIKSTVWQVLAAGSFGVGLLYALGIEGGAQVGGTISDGQFITAMTLILLAILFMQLGFHTEAREKREANGRHGHGKIRRNHARNPEYPHDKEMGA